MKMDRFRSILVDVDALAAVHPAMERAIEVARACDARLKVVDVVAMPGDVRSYLSQDIEEVIVRQRRERLAAIAGAAPGIRAEYDVLRGRASIELIREVMRAGHDLLVRSHARDLAAPKAFGAIDMQLFRQCPSPVWAVGPSATTAPRRVLAAVHASADDAEERALNRKILDAALLLAGFGGGTVTVFQAWSAFGEDLLRSDSKPEDAAAYVKAASDTARTALDDLVNSFGGRLGSARVKLKKGDPEDLIPPFVVSEGIDLVVMGTVARTGIAGFVIGNTAERLLQRLVCSVFAVKPDGFRTPVRLDE
jgi:nucleotide-binding universal stress UspA family protein